MCSRFFGLAHTAAMLSPRHLSLLGSEFGLEVQDLRWLRSSQNHVYECGPPTAPSILRVSCDRGRTLEEVEAELAWIDRLHDIGIPVSRARRSRHGRRCEVVVIDGVTHLVVQFDRAPGRPVELPDLTLELHTELGELTGRLHAASFDDPTAVSQPPLTARQPWYRSRLLTDDLERFTDPSAGDFRIAVQRLVERLRPRVDHRLGLLHADISFSNVFLDGAGLALFDFDNCEFGAIEQDFATILFDSIYCRLLHRVPTDELPTRVAERWQAFLVGYRRIRPSVEIDLELLREFLVLREAIIYVHYGRTVDLTTVRPGFREGMDEMRRNVEADVTPVAGFA